MDNKQKLYNALSEEYDLGTFEQFSADLDNEEKRRKLYDATSGDYDYGDYESFSAQLGYKEPFKMAEPFDMNKANEESLAGLTAPQQAYVPFPSTESQYDGQVPVIEQAPRRGFKAGAQESWKGLKAGTQFAYGEVVNGIFGSSQDDANALYELNEILRQGRDVASEVEDAWTDAGREIRTGALEFLPGWAIKGLKDRVYKEAEHQKILDDIREVLGETNGDVAKARQILEERAMDLSHGDRVKLDARRQFGNIRETEGFGAWLGENTVQMIPSASALIVGALTKSPAAARAIGMIGMGGMTAATSGSSMYEAREAGASDLETHKVGVVDGAIEYITEKLPFDNYTNWMVGKTKGKVATEVARALRSKNSPVRAEMEELLTMANKELGGKLFSKKNAAAYIADMVAEGASEFTAEASQTMTRLMYDNPDLFPLLGEALANGWQGALAGFFMGGVLGGASKTMEHHQNRERRQKQGYVDVGLVNFGTAENPDNDIVEVISVSEDTDLAQVLRDGAIINVNKNAIGQQYRYSYEAFEAGRMRVLESEALDNESVTQGMIQAADSREAIAEQNLVEALRASGMADDEIMTLLEDADADKIRMFDSPDIENAYNIYRDARHRARELRRTSARQAQSALNLKRLSIEENAGQFWRDNQTEDAEGNPIFNPTVETGLMQDGTRVYVLSDVNEQGECAAVTENGEKKIIKADMLQDGTQVFTLDEYLQSLVDADKVRQEQTRMVEQTQDRMTQARQAAQPGTQINLGTEEDPVIGSVVEQGPDGVIVQSEAGASQLTWDEYANAMHIGAPALTDNETAGVEAAEILSAESAYNNEVAQTESEAKEVADESGAALQEFEQADPLPRDADGNVDETTLWNDSPARWAEWNDEQRQDGGANSIQAIDAAVAKLSATIAEQQAAYGAMPVGKERNAVEQEIASLQERLAELLKVQQRYVVPVAEEVTETATEAPAAEVAEEPAVEAANPVRDMLTQLYNDPELSESEIEAFINANVQESQKALDKHLDKAPKMGTDMAKYKADRAKHQAKTAELEKQRDFWREVQSYIEMPDVTAMDMEPQNALEFTANELTRKDGVKLQRDSFTRHTGYGSEAGNFLSMLRTKQNGGLTLEEAGERLMEMDRENGTGFFDQSDPNAGLNAILEVIGGARTSGDVSGYIKANREQLAREEMAAARNAMMEEMIQPEVEIIDNLEEDLPEDIFMRTVDETEAIGGAATVKGRAKAWEKRLGIKVNVLEDVSQVKNRAIRKAIERGLQAPGWFDRATGEVCIYAPQIPNMSEVDKTVIHEVISHKGLRGFLGEEGFNALCDYVWQNMKPEARAKYLTYEGVLKGERKAEYSANPEAFIPTEKESRAAADEFIAGYSESMNTDKNAWQKMIDSVKRFISKLTGNYSLLDQLDELLEASLARYETIAKMDLQGVVEEGQTYGGIINAETGAKIDASSGIQVEGEDARFRITPEMDAEYLRAVEAGDMEAAQRMVIEAAKLAMPNTKVPGIVYHGTRAKDGEQPYNTITAGHFTDDYGFAEYYANASGEGFVYNTFVNIERPLIYDFKGQNSDYAVDENGERITTFSIIERARKDGKYDGVILKNVDEYGAGVEEEDGEYPGTITDIIPLSPSQIKSAEPVTYDDDGNVIPLSQRFNPENEDIRFRLVYHGTAAKFKKFDHAHMGEGEGAQAYGWGTYVTEVPGIGKTYAEAMRDKLVTDTQRENAIVNKLAADVLNAANGNRQEALNYLYGLLQESWSDKKRVKKEIKIITTGRNLPEGKAKAYLYTVDIPDNGIYIQYEQRMDSQAEILNSVIPALEKDGWQKVDNTLLEKEDKKIVINTHATGGDFYAELSHALGSDMNASNFLKRAGITGISYPAQYRSGGREDEKRNFVIFNEEDLEIVESIRFRVSNENQAIFVSNAAKAVEGIKQEKATPEQWLKMIEKNGGLKAGEDKWMGLSDWLKASDRKTLTKQEVLDFINENMIIIEEQHYSEDENALDGKRQEIQEALQGFFDEYVAESEDMNDDMFMKTHYDYAIQKLADELGYTAFNAPFINNNALVELDFYEDDLDTLHELNNKLGLEKYDGTRDINDTRLSYTTEGLTDKHEIALVVPTIESWNESDDIHFGDAGDGRAVAWIRFGDTKTYAKVYADFYAFQSQMQKKYFPDRVISALSDADLDSLTSEEKAEFIRLRDVARSIPMKDRTRRKVLVIDEIQSKRHQEGREQGYSMTKEEYQKRLDSLETEAGDRLKRRTELLRTLKEKYGEDFRAYLKLENTAYVPNESVMSPEEVQEWYETSQEEINDAIDALKKEKRAGIPDAPFDKNWHELAMKRMLRYAAENGYDVIAWTKGEQQAERYNIGNVVEHIDVAPYEAENSSEVNGFDVSIATGGVSTLDLYVTESGEITSGQYGPEDLVGQQLSDVVGKDLAAKILSTDRSENSVRYEGNDFRIGGEGMRGFYDKMLPAFMNKYGKKWGVKVEDINLPGLANGLTMHSVPVTEEMKASVMEGQVMFRVRGENESAMDFHQSMVDDFLAKYNPNAEVLVFPVNEETARMFGYTLEELKKRHGRYLPSYDFIAIFAREDIVEGEDVEGTLFHESIHKLAQFFDYMREAGKWMYENSDNNEVFAEYRKEIIDKNYAAYSDEKKHEEMLAHALEGAMKYGGTEWLLANVPDNSKNIINEILNEIGYDRERESTERVRRSAGESSIGESGTESLTGEKGPEAGGQSGIQETNRETAEGGTGSGIPQSEMAEDIQETVRGRESQSGGPRQTGADSGSEDISFRVTDITPEVRAEMNTISAIALVNGTYLKAPNGADTNLTPEQWALVRTKNFLRWFGDWINDPENASKVVDENGEPKVVYHGSPNEFNAFDEDMIGENTDSGFYGRGFYFATTEEESRGYGEYVIPAFLSMQNPLDLNELYAISDKWDGAAADGAVRWWYGLASMFPNDAISETVYASIDGEDWTIMDLKNRIDELAEKSETPFADAAEEFGIDEDFFDMMGEEDVNLPDELTDALKANGYDGVINAGVENNELVALYPSQIKSATDNTGEFSNEDGDIRYRIVTDPAKIEELENGPKIKVYRAMQLIDGKLYPPMSAKVDGQLREPIELGQWEEAEERPDLADNKGYFKLDKGNKTSIKARYNPYFHTSPTPLNDQFSSAQSRPELVTVEVEIPESELTSGYKAEKAKDGVGKMEWKAGVVQSKLSGTRTVILSRWDKPVRIVPDSEVADVIVKMFEGKDIVMPSNVVTPSLRAELESRGVPFVETDNQGKKLINNDSLPSRSTLGDGIRYRFIGEKGAANLDKAEEATMRLDNLTAARQMEKAGKNARDIKFATGWERGADNLWRYEEPDFWIDSHASYWLAEPTERKPLSEYVDKDDWKYFIQAYPSLKDLDIEIKEYEEYGGGYYDVDENLIVLRPSNGYKFNEAAIMHEVQHAIQEQEGFASGATPEMFIDDWWLYGLNEDTLLYALRLREQAEAYVAEGRYKRMGNAINHAAKIYEAFDNTDKEESIEVAKYRNSNELYNFMVSGKKDAVRKYLRTAGEVEARNVEDRFKRGWGNGEYRYHLATETEDISRKDQIFIEEAFKAATLGDGIRFRTREEAQELLNLMQENAETLIPRQLTEDIWKEEIEGRTFSSPIGTVRLGLNQFDKNINKGRAREFGMLIPTIERPDLIFEESAPEEGAERQTKYVFVKTFIDESGAKHINYASISVQKEGMEVVESSHRLRDKQVLNKIEKEQMLWNRFASDSTSSAPGISTDQSNALSDSKDNDYLDTDNEYDENISYRITGTPTEQVVAEGVSLSPADMARVAGRIFSVLPEEARREVTGSLNGNILGLQDAIMQIPARLAMKQDWDEQDMAVAEAIAAEMDRITPDKTRPFSTYEGLWMLYDALTPASSLNLMDQASRAIVKRNLGVDEATLERMKKDADDVRFRATETAEVDALVGAYNQSSSFWKNRLYEVFVDQYDSVDGLVKSIEESTGMKAKSFEDVVSALNQMPAKSGAKTTQMVRKYIIPMWDAIKELVTKYDLTEAKIARYTKLKHGLERNEEFPRRDARAFYRAAFEKKIASINADKSLSEAEKDAQKKKAQDDLDFHFASIESGSDAKFQEFREKDYSGIMAMYEDSYDNLADAEEAAKAEVESFEDGKENEIKELWKRINALNKATLKVQYETGQIGKAAYESLKEQFKYYVPLRGFEKETAEDQFSYYAREFSSFEAAVLKAKGRKTEAESPFGHMGAMMASAIVAGEKNEAKLALYYFALNRKDNGLLTIKDVWYIKREDSDAWELSLPPVKGEGESVADYGQRMDAWEDRMKTLQGEGKAKKGKQNLNLADIVHIDDSSEREHYIRVQVAGQEKWMIINGNPRAAQAINGLLNLESDPYFNKFFGKVMRELAQLSTSYNPEFWMTNLERDFMTTFATVVISEDAEYRKAFFKNYKEAWKVVKMLPKLKDGTLGDTGLEGILKEAVAGGLQTGFSHIKANEVWDKEMEQHFQDLDAGKAKQAIRSTFDKLQNFSESMELVSRFAVYMTSRQMGKSVAEAVADGKEVTANFNRKGSGRAISFEEAKKITTRSGKTFREEYGEIRGAIAEALIVAVSRFAEFGRKYILFFNASVQGLDKWFRLARRNKGNARKLAAYFGGQFALGFIMSLLYGMLDDDDEYQENVSDYDRRNNFMIGGNGYYIKVALPHDVRTFYGMGDIFYNYVSGNYKHHSVKEAAKTVAKQAGGLLPVNPFNGWSEFVPAFIKPIIEAGAPFNAFGIEGTNENFAGMPIRKETPWLTDEDLERTPKYTLAGDYTWDWLVNVSEALNRVTGGTYKEAGKIDIDPARIQHYIEGWTGGVGRTTGNFATFISQLIGEEEWKAANTPFLNKILTITDERSQNRLSNDQFYHYSDVGEAALSRAKTYEKDGEMELLAKEVKSDEYKIGFIYTDKKKERQYKKTEEMYRKQLKEAKDEAEEKRIKELRDANRKRFLKELEDLDLL